MRYRRNVMSLYAVVQSSTLVASTTSARLSFEASTSQFGVNATRFDNATSQLGIDASRGDDNDDDDTSWDYVQENTAFAIVSIVVLSVLMTAGTIGNVFVIGAIVAGKVRVCAKQKHVLYM